MKDKPFVQPSVMSAQQHFSQVPSIDIERSTFDRSHGYKTTFDAGQCVPFFIDECIPGDTHQLRTTGFFRLATPLKPTMDNIYLDIEYFFVPMRLLWTNWQKFMGERDNPDDDPNDYSVPMFAVNIPEEGYVNPSLNMHYLGLPMKSTVSPTGATSEISCLPARAYALIWNQWYRDENLQDSIPINFGDIGSGLDDDIYQSFPFPRGKRHDYFTSCLPWPQKGDPVSIPIGDEAVVRGYFQEPSANNWTPFATVNGGVGPALPVAVTSDQSPGATNGLLQYRAGGFPWEDSSAEPLFLDPNKQVGIADLSTATSISINDLRTAFQIQKLLERDARGGTRYTELLAAHFRVTSSDARLQRPEFIGGGSTRVNINPLASTVAVLGEDPVPQANLAGVGVAVNDNAGFNYSCEEHGYIIGIMSARADLTYQRTIERFWTRRTRYDFYWPEFAHLGEQAVLNRELHFHGDPSVDDTVFGYQERYAEYRYKPSRITGKFNSDCDGSLDVWHLAQDFGSNTPSLNADFIIENPPIDRIIAVPSEPHFLADIWHDYKSTRPMPVYSVPGLIDHF